ncbi:hypothetical protein ABZ215_24725 [Amycolatopsis sp. NPDC006131]|uniref:hypothetical protein n=1 Tax=Amycolatopsis sp. NPDC006131 TaxID=3156731 RepID=UPI0033AD8068
MRAEEIAALMVAGFQQQTTGNTDIGYHTGVIESWDTLTGLNTVDINGVTFTNLKVLSTGAGIVLSPGDTVVIMRFQTQYFILGRVSAPGAGAALGVRQDFVEPQIDITSGTFVASGGPTCTDVYVSSSRRVLVFLTAQIAAANCYGYASVQVSGASNIAAGVGDNAPASGGGFDLGNASSTGIVYLGATATTVQLFDQTMGLNEGLNTFTVLYQRATVTGYTPASPAAFRRRRLVVMPF